ncbi:TPA: hypothetical protein ACNV1G_004536 [Citrobacter amalonaticus]
MSERPELLTRGSTVQAAQNIVAWLKPETEGTTPDRVDVTERHIGQFSTADEVKRHLSGREGCIRVCALRVTEVENRNGLTGRVSWAAFIMATDAWGYSRDLRCEVIAASVMSRLTVRGAHTGMKAERAAENVRADNVYSGSLDGLGVAIWSVSWEQVFRLDEVVDLSTLDDFLRLGATVVHGSEPASDVINVR